MSGREEEMRHFRLILGIGLAALFGLAAPSVAATKSRGTLLDEYVRLLAIPNVASDLPNIERNARHISEMLRERGLTPRLLRVAGEVAPPAVFAEWRVPGAKRTYVLYAHYDGQPTTADGWASAPFTPVVRAGARLTDTVVPAPFAGTQPQDDWRVFARSASDDKLGVFAILTAIERLRESGRRPNYNLKIFFDGEEEAGSPHLAGILAAHRDLLQSDGWLIFDGPAHSSGPPQVVLGVRGAGSLEITTFGPIRPLHSGHYGNWAPDPAQSLATLLASLKDENGRVKVEGFYNDTAPISDLERQTIAKLPDSDKALAQELGIARPDGGGRKLAELVLEPSLDILGVRAADVGPGARNVIPATATATIGLRYAKGDVPKRQIARLIEHIRAQGYFVTDSEPTRAERLAHRRTAMVKAEVGYAAERTSLSNPFAQLVITAVSSRARPVVLPSIGGSLPLHVISDAFRAPTVTLSLANHDNNQHAENENLRLGNLWRAIDVAEAALLMQ
jgi:acetylornithine deacetylase/succinyl-diaminopimelate desuccinylase-like protein